MRFDFIHGEFSQEPLRSRADFDDPSRPALVGTDRALTWADLQREVLAMQEELRRLQPLRPVILFGRKEAGMVVSLLACYSLKIPYIPVDAMTPPARLQKIADLAGAEFIIEVKSGVVHTADQFLESLRPIEARLHSLASARSQSSTPPPSQPMPLTNLAYILFTSGSTGEPKGVQIVRSNVADLASWVASDDFAFSSEDVVLNQCAFGFDVSLFDLMAGLGSGGTVVLQNQTEPGVSGFGQPWCQTSPATVWSSTPSALSLALTMGDFNAQAHPQLHDFYLAGEVVHQTLAERLWRKFPKAKLWNAYGPTEATVITSLIEITKDWLKFPILPIGYAKPNVTLRTSAVDGVSEGELWIIGPNVSPGYLNRQDLNATRFFEYEGQRAYRTGDLAEIQDRVVFYRSRIDNQIKIHGFRVELEEIDVQVMRLEGVEAAATVPLRSGGDVKQLVCFLKLSPGFLATPEFLSQLKERLGKEVPYYMIPQKFQAVEALPINSSQKIDKTELLKRLGFDAQK